MGMLRQTNKPAMIALSLSFPGARSIRRLIQLGDRADAARVIAWCPPSRPKMDEFSLAARVRDKAWRVYAGSAKSARLLPKLQLLTDCVADAVPDLILQRDQRRGR